MNPGEMVASMTVVSRYYSADTLQPCENVTNPAKCLTATDIDTGVVAGRYVPDISRLKEKEKTPLEGTRDIFDINQNFQGNILWPFDKNFLLS